MGSGFSTAQVERNWRKTFRSRLSGDLWSSLWHAPTVLGYHLRNQGSFFLGIPEVLLLHLKKKSVLFSLLFTKLGN